MKIDKEWPSFHQMMEFLLDMYFEISNEPLCKILCLSSDFNSMNTLKRQPYLKIQDGRQSKSKSQITTFI